MIILAETPGERRSNARMTTFRFTIVVWYRSASSTL
jgi:hypothetical protein